MDSMKRSDLASHLANLLPDNISVDIYHLATPPIPTTPLYSAPPGITPDPTTRESHFVAVSHQSVLVFAIEVLVYVPAGSDKVTIFVSKADSSGYLPKDAASFAAKSCPASVESVFRTIAGGVVSYILEGYRKHMPNGEITISLFARSQSQYLFPNSAANDQKHVLSDQGLIRWWCKVLDPIVQANAKTGVEAFTLVPGSDKFQVQKLLPPAQEVSWKHGHPFKIHPDQNILVREVIPHFPDDPKARFLDELNGDQGDKKVKDRGLQWRNIVTVDDFWELMSHRQECSLGRCVGFMWVVLPGKEPEKKPQMDDASENKEESAAAEKGEDSKSAEKGVMVAMDNISTPVASQSSPEPSEEVTEPDASSQESTSLRRSPRKRPISAAALSILSPRKKRVKTPRPAETTVRQHPVVQATITLDGKRYQRAMDALLNHTDFGNREEAEASSMKWIQGVSAIHGLDQSAAWAVTVKGRVAVASQSEIDAARSSASVTEAKLAAETVKPVNMLGAGLIRKKKKT